MSSAGGGGGRDPLDQADIDAVLAAAAAAADAPAAPSSYDLPDEPSPSSPAGAAAVAALPPPGRAVWDSLDEPDGAGAASGDTHNLNLVLDIPLEMSVELGRKRMSIRDILDLGAGSIVELDKIAGEPVDLLVNGRLVARGEVVVIEDNFGVRITEIVGGRNASADPNAAPGAP